MQQGQRSIFVLDVLDKADFAFEAESLAQARELSEAPWFVQAVSAFYSRKCRERTRERTDGTFAARDPRPKPKHRSTETSPTSSQTGQIAFSLRI